MKAITEKRVKKKSDLWILIESEQQSKWKELEAKRLMMMEDKRGTWESKSEMNGNLVVNPFWSFVSCLVLQSLLSNLVKRRDLVYLLCLHSSGRKTCLISSGFCYRRRVKSVTYNSKWDFSSSWEQHKTWASRHFFVLEPLFSFPNSKQMLPSFQKLLRLHVSSLCRHSLSLQCLFLALGSMPFFSHTSFFDKELKM